MALVTLDKDRLLDNFPHRHFRVRHSLADHPLLSLERLVQAAERHPPHLSEHYSGHAAVSQDPRSAPRTGRGLVDTIRNIHESESWALLRHPEIDPEYRALLHAVVDEIRPLAEKRQKGVQRPEAYIFIASPGSVTPLHLDDEHNFLLHASGRKTFHAWTLDHPEIIGTRQLEHYYAGGHRNLYLPPHLKDPDLSFDLEPGDGLYVPVHTPHWVQNGDTVSISLSITFRTDKLMRDARVHLLNAKLRRKGFNPRPCGESRLTDTWKYWAARLGRRVVGRPQHY